MQEFARWSSQDYARYIEEYIQSLKNLQNDLEMTCINKEVIDFFEIFSYCFPTKTGNLTLFNSMDFEDLFSTNSEEFTNSQEVSSVLVKLTDLPIDLSNIRNKILFNSTSSFYKSSSMRLTATVLIDKNEAYLFHSKIDDNSSSRRQGVMGGRCLDVLSHEECAPSRHRLIKARARQDLT